MSDKTIALDVEIGAILRKCRKRAGLSMGDLGREVGRHESGIGQIERGERRMLVADLGAYARALGVPVVRLLPVGWRR